MTTIQEESVREVKSKTAHWAHQLYGHGLMKERDCILNWDMGTGKTKAVVDFIANDRGPGLHLIMCPLSVVPVWEGEFEKHGADPKSTEVVLLNTGSTDKSADKVTQILRMREYKCLKSAMSRTVFVVNYDSAWIRRLGMALKEIDWRVVVCDEIHRIKGPSGKASRFASKLKACRRIGLTGTLMPHGPLDAWAQFRFIDPDILGRSYTRFKSYYAIPHPFIRGATTGYRNTHEMMKILAPYTHRVEKSEVLDLPPVAHQTIPIALSSSGQKVYKKMEDDLVVEIKSGAVTASNGLVRLLRLQQITSGFLGDETVDTSKQNALSEIYESLADDEPIVVFCEFHHDLDVIIKTAVKHGRKAWELSGRKKQLATWKEQGGVLAVQIHAGGVGVDMTNACYCVYYSMGYSLGDYLQSLARLDRHGQTRPVSYLHLVAQGTVDVQTYKAMAQKLNVVTHLLELLKHERKHNEGG